MPTLKGKWYFKEVLTISSQDNFYISAGGDHNFVKFGDYETYEFTVSWNNYETPIVYGAGIVFPYTQTTVPDGILSTWADEKWRAIEFLETIEVTKEFYNWFTKNAVPLTIEKGVWRFNKHLKGTGEIVGTVDPHNNTNPGVFNFGVNYALTWCFTNGIPGDKNSIHSLTYEYIDGDPTGLEVYTSTDGWVDDSYRTIEIVEPLEAVNGSSAIWFYENARSAELKLYSECYIAETADKIRECTNDNTLTFKVSDLADGVQLAYDAGYSKGSSENSLDLEALGALCEFDWSTDSNSYPIFTVINHHPTYYLHADVSSTTNGNIFVIDNDEWSPSSGDDPLSYDTDLGTKSSTITVEPNDSYSCYIQVRLSSLTPGGMNVNTVYLKNMRWTASE